MSKYLKYAKKYINYYHFNITTKWLLIKLIYGVIKGK